MHSKHIIVVGAGIAGLTAAYRLQQAGHAVTVLEKQAEAGGRMLTIHWQGLSIDPGAEFITGADKYLHALVDELGIRAGMIDYSQEQTGFNVQVMRDGKVHTVNFMSIGSYMRWSAVSLGARLALARLLPHLLRYRKIDVYAPELAPGDDDQTMEEFFYAKVSPEMFEYWVEPTMDVFCGYTPEDLSAKMMLILYGSYLSQKLYTFQGGIAALPHALAARLDVRYSATVTEIAMRDDNQAARVTYQQDGSEHVLEAEGVVVAVTGDAALGLFSITRPAWLEFFPQVRYSRVGIVYHLLEGDEKIFDEGGIMFPRKEGWKLAALGWKRHPDGRVLAMSDLKSALYNPAITDDELKATITAEVERAVPQFKGRIRDQMVFRWARKVPAYRVGYLSALQRFKADMQENPVYFCGDYLAGPNAGAALATGWRCAERVLAADTSP